MNVPEFPTIRALVGAVTLFAAAAAAAQPLPNIPTGGGSSLIEVPNLADIVEGYGFANVPARFSSVISSDLLSNSNGLNLDVMDNTFCAALGRGR